MCTKYLNVLLLSSLFLFSISSTASAEYALEISLTGSSPDGYQLKLTIPHEEGMDANFANVRFFEGATRHAGGTELSYWLETSSGSSANFWVPVPAGSKKIYCQWGIEGETVSESNGKRVFPLLFDNFSEPSLNSTVWESSKLGSTGAIVMRTTTYGGVLRLRGDNFRISSASVVSTQTFDRPFVLEYVDLASSSYYSDVSIGSGDLQDTSGGATDWWHTTLADGYSFNSQDASNSQILRSTTGSNSTLLYNNQTANIFYPSLSVFFRHSITMDASAIAFARNNTDVTSLSDATHSNDLKIAFHQGEYSNGNGGDRYISWILVRDFDATPVTATVSSTVLSAPVAAFSGTPTSGVLPFSVVFEDESTGSPVSWFWDFGDGFTSTSQTVTHTYETAGNFTVTLTVENTIGENTTAKTDYINVLSPATAPVINWTTSTTSGTLPLTVQFTDTSTENPTSWEWNFGDGSTSTAQNPTHTYTTAGSFTVTLTATNALGATTRTKTNHITTSYPLPVASFTSRKTSFYEWTFTDTSTGYTTSYLWNFGDGTTSTVQTPVHNYGKNGTYTVTLTVSNPAGVDTETHTIQMLAQEGDAEIETSSENVLILDENTSYTFNFSSNITLDHTEFWVNGDLFTVEGNELIYNFTEGGVYYNVTAYGVSASGNYSAPITWRVTVHRGVASKHIEKFDETNYNYLIDSITHFNTTSIAETSMAPFTDLMGRAFYIVLFVMPFALLWIKQRMLTIPVVMALITGCLMISFIPTQYMGFLTYAVILSFAVALYLLGRERF